jgi:hypothetical protein
MKHGQNFPRGNKFFAWLTAGTVACQILSFATSASAQIVNLTNGNASSQIDLGSPTNMFNWVIDGVNVLTRQSFFYRTNPGGVGSSISPLAITQLIPNSVSATFAGNGFSVTTVYNLIGGANGSGTADMSEQIKVQNNTAAPLVFNFFQYANFAGNGIVELGQNSRGFFNEAFISGGGLVVTENLDTGISPGANDGAVGDPGTLLNEITGTPGFTPGGPNSGPGAWALEWERTIGANGSLIISKDLNAAGVTVAPEPPAWSLVSIGLIAFGALKQYRSRRSK